MRRSCSVLTLLSAVAFSAALLLPSAPARADEAVADDWMALFIGGGKSGWTHTRTARAEEGGKAVWVTTNETTFSLARLGSPMTITTSGTTVEDEAGMVLRFTQVQEQGPTKMTTEGTVADGKIRLVKNGVTSDLTYPAGALGPAAAERKLREKGIKAGVSIEMVAFTAEAPDQVVTATSTIGAQEKKDVLGRVLFLHPVDVKNSLIPIPTTVWVDERGRSFAMSMQIPGLGDMDFYKTDEAIAKADIQPAELFEQNEIEPDVAIAKPRELKKATYRISRKAGKGGPLEKVYAGEGQSVVAKDGKVDVTVEVWTPAADFKAATRPWAPAGMENFLKPTAYLETGDELLKKMAAEAVGDETDAVKCARQIEEYVRKKISKKNFNVGFATAAETARSLEGDCSEHGVLCAALARAAGLPARVCVGIVYVGSDEFGPGAKKRPRGVFGFHMWTEVLVAEGRWLAIDAAIGVYDATHIAFVKSDLSAASPELELALATIQVIGSIDLEVVEPR